MGQVAGRFARLEPRRRARAFVLEIFSGLRRKNCWTLAEQAGDATPDGMQHLLAGAVWTPMRSAMTCAATWWSICAIPAPCWWLIYADPGTMPTRGRRDAKAVGGAGFWRWRGLRCSA